MDILFFITLALLFVALFFVWKFWRERNAYRAAYLGAISYQPSMFSSVVPALIGYIAGIFVGKKIFGSDNNE